MTTVDLALAGVGIGCIASLSGLGFLLTYRLTGVFNLAFGATGMAAAFLLWQQVQVWHWPLVPAALLDIGVGCPLFGVLLERLVFRPLQRRRASAAERLVASLGVLVLLLGMATVLWGNQTRLDAPSLVPRRRLTLPGGTVVPLSTLVDLGVVAVVCVVAVAARRRRFGLRVRAVVEHRALAELTGVDADRVSMLGWAIGCTMSGIVGVLLAPTLRLEPFGFTLVILETLAVVVAARLADPVRAVLVGLAIGVAQAELTRVHVSGWRRPLLEALTSNLFVVALLVAVLVVDRLDEVGAGDAGTTAPLTRRPGRREVRGWWAPPAALVAFPLLFGSEDLRTALAAPALAIVLVSIVVVSGYGGQLSLGQAGFAGLGAVVAARLAAGTLFGLPRISGVAVLAVAPVVVAPLGLLLGWPAIRRRGLFLALTTFAFSVAVSRFVFDQPSLAGNLAVAPPAGLGADGNFYVVELVCLGLALALVHTLHRGRIGRALIAMRDDEQGAAACGVDVRRLKMITFAASAGLAALGGTLLSMGARAFDAAAFDPIRGLIWFAAVVVFGVDSATGAVLGAALLVGLDAAFQDGTSTLVVGGAAVLLGWMPGGVLARARQLAGDAIGRTGVRRRPAVPAPALVPTPALVALRRRAASRRSA